jgi:predicted secreted protein
MAILTGNNGVVKIDNAAGSPTAFAAVRNFTIEITRDTIETTTMGKDVRSYVAGLSSFSGSADIYFDPAEMPTSGASGLVALNPTLGSVGDAPLTFVGYLNGSANKFAGEIIVTGFTINSSMDGMVEASISFQGSGDVNDVGITYSAI